jgi:beta-aspartyl-peptidase (threonine type)
VSCTGTGELFIRHAIAYDVVARMLYGKATITEAAGQAVEQLPDEEGGSGGLIALDGQGRHAYAMTAKTAGIYRGHVTEKGEIYIAIGAKEPFKQFSLVPEKK